MYPCKLSTPPPLQGDTCSPGRKAEIKVCGVCGYLYEVFSLEVLLDITVTFSVETVFDALYLVYLQLNLALNKSSFTKVL